MPRPEPPVKRGDRVKCPPGARRWHTVRRVRARWTKAARGRPKRVVGWEVAFRGPVSGARQWMSWEWMERVGVKVKPKEAKDEWPASAAHSGRRRSEGMSDGLRLAELGATQELFL